MHKKYSVDPSNKTFCYTKKIFGSINKSFVQLKKNFFENKQTILLDKQIFFTVYKINLLIFQNLRELKKIFLQF